LVKKLREPVSKWYDKLVGQNGQEYHERLIFSELFKELQLTDKDSVLDLGCGQGVLAVNFKWHSILWCGCIWQSHFIC
jgi:ubiquinone/menaquinone biosynthesis C-methylase UbiE